MSMQPSSPILTMAKLATGWLVLGLRVLVLGWGAPSGQAVTKVGVVALTAVMLRATAVAEAGTWPGPVPRTWTLMDLPAPMGVLGTPSDPVRVSNRRCGVAAVKAVVAMK